MEDLSLTDNKQELIKNFDMMGGRGVVWERSDFRQVTAEHTGVTQNTR